MKQADFDEFARIYDAVCGIYGKAVDATQKAMFFRLLAKHSIEAVKGAFEAHCSDTTRGRFAPLPADLLAQIEAAAADDGRPGPEEAWALALRADDEARTIVWTAETAEAYGICRVILHAGDEVGARMAFREAYARLVTTARAKRQPVRWSPSMGHDEAQRDEALRLAVESGRLPMAYLPAPTPSGPVAGLLELSQQRGCPPAVKAKLDAIRAQLTGPREDHPGGDWMAKQRTADLKAQAQAAVDRAMKGSSNEH